MNRREFLECGALLIAGVSATRIGWTLTNEQHAYLASAPDFVDTQTDFFSDHHRKIVAASAEAIIPRTDTPGAIDAGVPRFIELMVENWLNGQERSVFEKGLQTLALLAQKTHGKAFYELSNSEQVGILNALEKEAGSSVWYQPGNVYRDFVSDAPFICQLKELTIWGFFTSRVGSTQVLRYEPMPMRFDGEVKLEPNESSWATDLSVS